MWDEADAVTNALVECNVNDGANAIKQVNAAILQCPSKEHDEEYCGRQESPRERECGAESVRGATTALARRSAMLAVKAVLALRGGKRGWVNHDGVVRLSQCRCSKGHCFLGFRQRECRAGEEDKGKARCGNSDLTGRITSLIAVHGLNALVTLEATVYTDREA